MKDKLYLCGGSIRDELLGLNPKDMDYVALFESMDELREAILSMGGKIYVEKPETLVIRAKLPEVGDADFALGRKEGVYSDGRHPDSTDITLDLYEDSCRRDFTIGAMYKNLETGEIIDFHNGKKDLKDKKLRCVGRAQDRFAEDYLRICRIIRFSVTKHFSMGVKEMACLHDPSIVENLQKLPIERIYEEFKKMFMYDSFRSIEILNQFSFVKDIVFREMGLKLEPVLKGKKKKKKK